MDIDKYIAGKVSGVSKIERHGESTLLITVPGGFDADTGAPKAPVEQGYQPDDLDAMEAHAAQGVEAAQKALAEAEQRLANMRGLKADAEPLVVEIRAEYAARVQEAQAAIAEGSAQVDGK